MPKPSKIDRLPPEIREMIADLRAKGYTLDEIMAHLQRLDGIDPALMPSRSGVGRHIQGLDALSEKLHRSRTIAEALTKNVGEKESRLLQANVEMMHAVVTDLILAAENGEWTGDGDDAQPVAAALTDPAQVMFLAKALDHLAKARKSDADMVLTIRREVAKAAVKAVDQAVRTAAASGEKGLSAEAIERLKRDLAGMA